MTSLTATATNSSITLIQPVRQWLDSMEIHNPKVARLLCHIIPNRCPFEREIKFFGRTVFCMPPLCKLNPVYEQVVSLRFRCLSYLVEECGEDIAVYC